MHRDRREGDSSFSESRASSDLCFVSIVRTRCRDSGISHCSLEFCHSRLAVAPTGERLES